MAIVAMVGHGFFGIRSFRDLGADDEAWYLGSGVLLGRPGFPNGPSGWPIPEQGPVYSLWYFALSKLWRDPMELYYASWQLVATALALAIYVVVRRAGAPWWQALLGTFFYVNSVLADIWPFPTYFSSLLVLLGVLASARARTKGGMLAVVAVALALAGFARPEMMSAYFVVLLLALIQAVRERRVRLLLVAVAPGALLYALLGNPFLGMRSYYAFVQHYALALSLDAPGTFDPWASWPAIAERDFPGTWTVSQIIRQNPGAVLAHVGRNVRLFPRIFLALTDVLDASKGVQLVLVAIAAWFGATQLRRAALVARSNMVCRALFVALGCCAVPFVLSCVVIHPRPHYFVTVTVLLVALAFVAPLPLPRSPWRPAPNRRALVAFAGAFAFCALLVTSTVRRDSLPTFEDWLLQRDTRPLFGERQRTAVFLRNLELPQSVTMMEDQWGTCLYAGYRACTRHLRFEKDRPFDDFVQSLDLDVIVVAPSLPADPHFSGDPAWADFLRDPGRHGFELLDVPGTHVRVARRVAR